MMESPTQAHSTTENTRIPSGNRAKLASLASVIGSNPIWKDRTWTYPTPTTDGAVTETLYGCEISDPYRSLEILENESTQKYIKEQNQVSLVVTFTKSVIDR
jgi:hypothetical protein